MLGAATMILPEEEAETLKAIYREALDSSSAKQYFSRAQRKEKIRKYRQLGLDENEIAAVNLMMKRDYSGFVASLIEKIAASVIDYANKGKKAMFLSSLGSKSPEERGVEGSRVRIAIGALKAMDKLIAIGFSKKGLKQTLKWRERLQNLKGIKRRLSSLLKIE